MKYVRIITYMLCSMTSVALACHGADPVGLHEGYWVLMFAVYPGCPACEVAMVWLGRAANTHPGINALLVCPWLMDELKEAAGEAKLSLVVDEGGLLGADLDVERAPTVVCLLDRQPVARLDWPFGEGDLVQGIEELAATPREGPWQHLGAAVLLGTVATLEGGSVELDCVPGPWLLSFYSSQCPACRADLPTLVELSDEIQMVLAVMAFDELSMHDREMLAKTGLRAVLDDEGVLAERLTLRVTPTHVLMDREGRISWVQEGVLKAEELRAAILVALGENAEDRKAQKGGS